MLGKVAAVFLLALVAGEQATAVHILHVKLDNDHLIKVGNTSFGLTGPALKDRYFSSITVNGKSVVKFDLECKESITDLDKLSKDDLQLMETVGQRLNHLATPISPLEVGEKYAKTLYVGHSSHIDSTAGITSQTHKMAKYNVVVHDGEYSVESVDAQKSPLPFNWLLYFVMNDHIAVVSKPNTNGDNHLDIMPRGCIHSAQREFIERVEKEFQESGIIAEKSS